jgi:hypothetical protein
MFEEDQSRLTDLALNKTPPEILQHPPFFTGQHLKITACKEKQQKKEKNNGALIIGIWGCQVYTHLS